MLTWASQAILRSGLSLALICSSYLTFAQTLQPYGICTPPAQEGVNFCSPYSGLTEIPSPFQVIGAGTSGHGQVANMQLWADGKKIMQTTGTPFDEPITLPPGYHRLTLIEVDDTGAFAKSTTLDIITTGNGGGTKCSPPSTPGVKICSPAAGCNVEPSIEVSAAGRGQSSPVVRMELWILNSSGNTAKIANFPGDKILTNLVIFDAFYTLEVREVDRNGHTLKTDLAQDGPC